MVDGPNAPGMGKNIKNVKKVKNGLKSLKKFRQRAPGWEAKKPRKLIFRFSLRAARGAAWSIVKIGEMLRKFFLKLLLLLLLLMRAYLLT